MPILVSGIYTLDWGGHGELLLLVVLTTTECYHNGTCRMHTHCFAVAKRVAPLLIAMTDAVSIADIIAMLAIESGAILQFTCTVVCGLHTLLQSRDGAIMPLWMDLEMEQVLSMLLFPLIRTRRMDIPFNGPAS